MKMKESNNIKNVATCKLIQQDQVSLENKETKNFETKSPIRRMFLRKEDNIFLTNESINKRPLSSYYL